MENNLSGKYTIAGTDIEEVKRKNAESGLSYNEVKELIARTTGGHGTTQYSNTDPEEIQKQIQHDLSSKEDS